jgi:long-chain acyl-CoA synthetase
MNFLETIFEKLAATPEKPILQEIREGQLVTATCAELLYGIEKVRRILRHAGLRAGERCALLAPNSIQWVAVDLAIMAEGAIVVPLYSRQSPEELIQMMKDCTPSILCCADTGLRDGIASRWLESPRILLFDILFENEISPKNGFGSPSCPVPFKRPDDSPATIIYTSGTSGEAKGVVLSLANISFMLERTSARLEELMKSVPVPGDHRVFHYLPFCFAGSWITLLTCLARNNNLMLSMDLNKLADEISLVAPHYFLNVPAVLERIRNGVNTQLKKKGGVGRFLFVRGNAAWQRQRQGQARLGDPLWLSLSRRLVFCKIRQRLGPNLRALICGSAPLAEETQHFFMMLGIPVLQVYGLTETTAICTMDEVGRFVPGRVGPAISGIEMCLGSQDEILVRGPNVFPGYWNRPQATTEMLREGWLHTGDQGEIDTSGNWKITGRIKDLIITSGGHNISPETLEQALSGILPDADHVMVVGNGRKFVSALITGTVSEDQARQAIESLNQHLPHYRQIRRYHLCTEPFTVENGLITANRKLKRLAIETLYQVEIASLYRE